MSKHRREFKTKPRYRLDAETGEWIHVCACGCGTPLNDENNRWAMSHHRRDPRINEAIKRRRGARQEKRWEEHDRCTAIKRDGERCRNAVYLGRGRCGVHTASTRNRLPQPGWSGL